MKSQFFSLALASLFGSHAIAQSQLTDIRDLRVVRNGSVLMLDNKPWKAVGANVYWLGLDENVTPPPGSPYYAPLHASYPSPGRITQIMSIINAMGGTMIRSHTLGVSVGNPLSLWPSPNQTNPEAFTPIDWAVYQARVYGLRLMVPLVDNFDYYHGGKYTFLRWAGFNLSRSGDERNPQVQEFYNNPKVVDLFKRYIESLLTHRNPYTNLTYAEDPTIFAIETGNELCGPVWGDMDVPTEWVRDIGRFVKGLAPGKLFVDGTYGVNRTHFGVEEVDIFSNHYYPVSTTKLQRDLEALASVDKPYFAGEYGWLGNAATADASLPAWYREIERNPKVMGDTFWSLFGHNVPDCNTFVEHNDGFTMQYGNPAHAAQIRIIRQHFVKMSQDLSISADAELPQVPCPAPTSLTP
ncbi:glycoside hydrolase superfamily [Apiosordaria backusii]|uniref:mannan endo-1,4-beta-mannosidase n=1 Tax=Apiosordaria backusii TaxID=314023 RepID=A0AA40K6G9_9PEZI|nr:glycoside hydrolase superfamily [Apiosordaria backusii]